MPDIMTAHDLVGVNGEPERFLKNRLSISTHANSDIEFPKLWSRIGTSTLPVRKHSQTAMNDGSAVRAIVMGSNEKPPWE